MEVSKNPKFLTFTYDDAHLPASKSLHARHLTNFWKKLRKELDSWSDSKIQIKYYAIGEYGSRTQRPHYHSITFNLPTFYTEHPLNLERIWGHGHVHVDPCNAATIGYVIGYVLKKSTNGTYKHFTETYNIHTQEKQHRFTLSHIDPNDPREPEYSVMSKKLGLSYLTNATVKYHRSNLNPYCLADGGGKIAIPTYYIDKLFTKKEQNIIKTKSLQYLLQQPEYIEKIKLDKIRDAFRKSERAIREKRQQL